MKITLEGVTRVLDLQHINMKPTMAIQDYLGGMAIFAWQERLTGVGDAKTGDYEADPAGTLRRMPMFTDPAWIKGMAAAHWLMLTQAGENPPPLDDYDGDVLGFAVAFLTALGEEVRAKRVPDKPGPTARPGRRTPSSRPTAARKPKTAKGEVVRPLPLTGS